eukprot:2125201-Rhodomonas_salina.1
MAVRCFRKWMRWFRTGLHWFRAWLHWFLAWFLLWLKAGGKGGRERTVGADVEEGCLLHA